MIQGTLHTHSDYSVKLVGRELSNEVKAFIDEHIHSVLELEVLGLLSENRDKRWTADAVGRELQLSPRSAKVQLDKLLSHDLLIQDPTGEEYRYNPPCDDLNKTVNQMLGAYKTQRVAILTLIFAKRVDTVRLFTETFRMIKGDE